MRAGAADLPSSLLQPGRCVQGAVASASACPHVPRVPHLILYTERAVYSWHARQAATLKANLAPSSPVHVPFGHFASGPTVSCAAFMAACQPHNTPHLILHFLALTLPGCTSCRCNLHSKCPPGSADCAPRWRSQASTLLTLMPGRGSYSPEHEHSPIRKHLLTALRHSAQKNRRSRERA